MAKITFNEGFSDFKDPGGNLIFYTRNGKTFVRGKKRAKVEIGDGAVDSTGVNADLERLGIVEVVKE